MPAKKTTTPKPKPEPRQAHVYPTLKEWVGNEANRQFVKSLLNDRRFLALLHYAKDIHRVTVDELVGERAKLDEVILRKAAVHAGAVEFENTLRMLLREPGAKYEPEAWEHVIPKTQ